VRAPCELIVIDEVGPLELREEGLAPAVRTALSELSAAQELVLVVRSSLVQEVMRVFHSALWDSARRIEPPWPSLEGRKP